MEHVPGLAQGRAIEIFSGLSCVAIDKELGQSPPVVDAQTNIRIRRNNRVQTRNILKRSHPHACNPLKP